MNIIFLTLAGLRDINRRGIYSDLMRKFRDEGHNVYIVSPAERKQHLPTALHHNDGVYKLDVRTLNIQKTNIIEKGLGTILLEGQFKRAIRKHLADVSFDIILYSTPPITFTGVVRMLKRRNPRAISYLLLKDIFPQNAVDLGMFSAGSLFYKYFRRKEVALYRASDYIGCMSPANVRFVLDHNPFIREEQVEVAPNSIALDAEPVVDPQERDTIRRKYGLPLDRPVFIYGGNLGRPQGVPFLIECLEHLRHRTDCFFLVVGSGTEFPRLQQWYEKARPANTRIFSALPKADYDRLVRSCDVGLIFLDHNFLIPNYPSRLLSYLECKMPVIAATDPNTDIGLLAEQNGYGRRCESNSVTAFEECVDHYITHPQDIRLHGQRGYQFLTDHYLVRHTYRAIMQHLD